MNSARNYFLAVLAILVAGESVLAWRQYQELIVLRAQVGSDDAAGLRQRLLADQNRIKALQDQLAANRRTRGTEQSGAAAGENAPAGRPDWRGGFRQAMNNPEFVKLMGIQQRAGLDGRYASLFKALNLSPEQLDQFKNLLVQKQQAVTDALQAARDQGINPRTDPQAFGEAVSAAQAAIDQQIQASLGAAGYAQYQQYEQTLPQRNTVNQVQQSLSYSSSPLTDDQANQLIQILAQDAPQGGGSANGNLRNLLNPNPTSPITAQAIVDAAGVLTQAQVQALVQIQQAQVARQQMQQLMRGNPPPAPSP